jgi:hypothetical protein
MNGRKAVLGRNFTHNKIIIRRATRIEQIELCGWLL